MGACVLAFFISFPLCCSVSMQQNQLLFTMNGFPIASSSFPQVGRATNSQNILRTFPHPLTHLPLSLDMILNSGTKRVLNFLLDGKCQRTQQPKDKKNPGAILTFFTLMDHHGHIILWHVDTKAICGCACKTWCVQQLLYNLKKSA